MPCNDPLRAWWGPGGAVVFKPSEGWIDRPLLVPCGRCWGCRIDKSKEWAVRCTHEAQMHDRNSFITLTYSDEMLPPDGGLHVEHWQLFAKRLRKKIGSFRYFHCGEYGDLNDRPHYHAAIFGLDFSGDRTLLKNQNGNKLYRSKLLEDAWAMGHCSVGNLTFESAAYIARYTMKKITGDQAEEHYQRIDPDTGEVFQVNPEYISMSRRPGIGKTWIDKYKDDVYPGDQVVINGKKYKPPRYYDQQVKPEILQSLKFKREERARKRAKENTPERLVVKEKVLRIKMKELKRQL